MFSQVCICYSLRATGRVDDLEGPLPWPALEALSVMEM